ncbi:MAG: glucosamine-6-phosphate deaminase [Verrucomicrobiota bacterium JB024]|nr:glucosamine-6-phosphate deaminase [Verrucomicrobiota bacterium JB024]
MSVNDSTFDRLKVHTAADRPTQGEAAASHVLATLNDTLARQGHARVIFACAPSQDDFLRALVAQKDAVDWQRVTVFHMDEYIGLSADQPQSFRYYLQEHLLRHVHVRAFHAIGGNAPSIPQECVRYTALLKEAPVDLVCMGIGENGHIAFNDPGVADFEDPLTIKPAELDRECRVQQVNDGCFPTLDEVPTHALTLTVPTLFNCKHVSCVVPGKLKAAAVRETLLGSISPACPATILRTHPSARLFLDPDAAYLLDTVAS